MFIKYLLYVSIIVIKNRQRDSGNRLWNVGAQLVQSNVHQVPPTRLEAALRSALGREIRLGRFLDYCCCSALVIVFLPLGRCDDLKGSQLMLMLFTSNF